MNNLEIKINIKKIKNYSSSLSRSLDEKTLLSAIKSFSKYVMDLYMSLIADAVYESNRYKGQWEPLADEGYKEYLGTNPTGNILYYIKDALEVKKTGYNFIIRMNPEKKYPGSKLSVERVALALDNGTSKFYARPILKKIVYQIRSHILELWRGYLVIRGVI